VYRFHRDQRGQSLFIVLSLITILFLLGSALAVHASAALRATRASEGQGNDFYAADAATELGIWWQRNARPATHRLRRSTA
jgi:Tfp pilus assembly protein PilX